MKLKLLSFRLLAAMIVALAFLMLPSQESFADSSTPLCFTAKSAGATVRFSFNSYNVTIQTSRTNNGTDWTNYSNYTTITLTNVGDKVYFRAATQHNLSFNPAFSFSDTIEASGNIMSLYGPDCPNITLPEYAFSQMFYGCTFLTTAPELPATDLSDSCYFGMFDGCTSLTTAPSLPATTLADGCYNRMFYGCTTLTTAPSLPATTLADRCYYQMFFDCMSLTTAPALPATTMAQSCYYQMFDGCMSLTTTPALPATSLADSCYGFMFYGCTSLTTAPSLPATTLAQWCYRGMFRGCTSLTTAPSLPATTLADHCYEGMFFDCTSLITAPALPATTLANNCYLDMFRGCTSLTTAPSLPATTLAGTCYCYMFGDCTSLTTAPSLPATTLADHCYEGMFFDCTSLITAPSLPATTLADHCYEGMFYGCTSLTTAPSLPATTLADWCYGYMFYGCTSLTTAPSLPATTLADWCYGYMFSGCTSLITAPSLPVTTLAVGCYYQMFKGCTSLVVNTVPPGTAWVIPANANVSNALYWNTNMFSGTRGTFTGDPVKGQTYYIASDPNSSAKHILASTHTPNWGTVTGSGYYTYGDTAILVAVPNTHYHLDHWSNGKTSLMIKVPAYGDSTLVATFAGDAHNVTGVANDANMGTVSGSGTYSYGQKAILEAVANNHYHFVNWSNGSTTPTLLFTVVSDTLLTANFVGDQCLVTAYANDGTMGYATGGGYYNYGTTATLMAGPYTHYRFVNWSNGMTTPTIKISVDGNKSLTAFFEPELYYITAVANYSNRGTVTGSGPYQYGQTATLIATPNEGYRFDHWSNGLTSQVIYVVAECDSTITAVFEATGTGIDDVEDGNDIILAPNPVSAGEPIYITGDFTADDLDGMTIDVFNMDGVQVSHVALATSHVEIPGIDVSGTYIVRIATGTDKVYAIKLIVK